MLPALRIASYDLQELIHQGTNTAIYRAVSIANRLPAILKVLNTEYPTLEQITRLKHEYQITAYLDCEHTVKVDRLEIHPNCLVLILEDFGGISLKQWMAKAGNAGRISATHETQPLADGGESAAIRTTVVEAATARYQLPIAQFLNIAIQLAKALVFLHQNQIIHKDIKPANVIINPETMQVKLADFSIASRLNKETPNLKNPDRLEGTLAYMSPEQTGRMNRAVDYRSDFYSLGVTFYELLTGKLPFTSNEPLELVHCHIAKQPIPLQELNPQIPPVLAEIAEKLMAKNAEDRYQTATGLLADLERCQNQIEDSGKISNFIPGQLDAMSQLLIPQKLYGREKQITQLLQAFDRASKGSSEIVLVGGYSGIGKSALVHEILRNLTRQRGYLVSGKFDQFKRNVPYACFNQAMRSLVQQILTESQAQIESWREKMLRVLDANARIAIEVIPELELILGPQPDVAQLGAIESQNRFNRVMQQLLQAIATAEHPLVMFLDDCQWIDAATVNLYQQNGLAKIPYLLVIVAYRDNEVSPTHPLMLANEAIRAAGIPITAITLEPLAIGSAIQLIAETLRCAAETASPLANLLVQKTDGNPFFFKQMLKYLHQKGWLRFHPQAAEWQWDIKHIQRQDISENVVDLMVNKIKTLSTATQRILQLAACTDNQFSLDVLSVASGQSWTQTAQDLWEALQVGLILPVGNSYRIPQVFEPEELEKLGITAGDVCYKFMHDRVQQAAYAMIPDAQKEPVHLAIGRLLLHRSTASQRQERIFDIVNHLNFAGGLISELSEKYELAELNLQAGKTAKAASAFETALSFFQSGCNCLSAQSWEDNYALTWALYFELGEAEYLNGKNDEALAILDFILPPTQTLLERCRINELKMTCLRMKNDLPAAYQLGIETLQLLGIEFEADPDDGYLLRELAKTKEMIGGSIANLADLPELTDPLQLAAHRILKELYPIAYFTSPNAQFLCAMKFVQATIEHGNCRISAFGYIVYAFTLIVKYGEIEAGLAAGELGLTLYERWDAKELSAYIFLLWGACLHYIKHIDESKVFIVKAFNSGLETGAYQWSGYAAINCLWFSFYGNESLQKTTAVIEEFIPVLQKIDRNMLAFFMLNKSAIARLTRAAESAENPPTFIDEESLLEFAEASADLMTSCVVYIYKLTVANWFGEVDRALEYANIGAKFLPGVAGIFLSPVFCFHRAIALAAACTNASEGENRQIYLEQLNLSLEELREFAKNCPANYQHKYLAIRAEVARLSGQKYEAAECYDSAIALAIENGFIQDAALVNELAARFYFSQNRLIFVKNYLNDARVCYLQWGATAKVRQLEQYYANLFPEAVELRIAATVTASTSSHANVLDLATVIKASEAIYSEIVLEKLLKKLLHIILENAGAQKGCILLERDGQLFVEVSDTNRMTSATFQESMLVENSSDVAISIIKYVGITQQPLVLSDASQEKIYQADTYIQNCQPKSILCAPILYQTKLIGIVYLENNMAIGAFTRDRLELLQLLTTQAAIAIENARLYAREQHKSRQLTESLENLQQFQVELIQKEQQYRSIFETVVDGLSLMELDTGKFIAANPALCQIYGYSQEELLRLTPPDYILPEYLHLFAEWQQTIRRRQEFSCQAVIQRKDGTLCDVEVKANFFEYDAQPHALVINRDISDRKRAEKAVQTSEAQLRQKAEDLEAILIQLQQTQAQLVQTEKISQLGQLVAGVAHEVNNPVSFISGNLHHAKDYVSDLISLVQVYQDNFPDPGQQVLDEIEAIELEYLVEDLPKMIDSMRLGTDRIRDIMQSLRNYSRSDGIEKKPANIHEGIDTTLMILSHRLKANSHRPTIQVIKNYGELPNIECYPGQLNQVFMNLIANAIDALEESNFGKTYKQIESNPNIITISTSAENSSEKLINRTVKIRIADNGLGMSKDIKRKLFTPFFTTKAEGKGTGLGLPICHDIVTKKHGGSLECVSAPGIGTEFAIALPVHNIPIKDN
ncbi:AAA family ATPase [Lyngbya sp. CCAP 1446/10]|uniref:trifunctional serine/threonine-protein kinase/ATP-binding protein/sensor histidine kinase n=1 Tax=Lyngbya sp. CCAP 1446/10 TaxID=439293 RepID=UPI002238D960|nr:ATP-binding sensor histidine kinase [Lyngbya sp. CCAP 1446/10]MCW6052093.1 AAA family ATPase [Lyngbya sp. CCAP 1446/10]